MEAKTEKNMVMVPVPDYLVTDVYRFIVAEEERRTKGAGGEQDGSGSLRDEEWRYSYSWSEDNLRDVLENGTRAMKIILPYLAEHPDEKVKGQVLAELVYGEGARMQQLGGALGSFTKTALKRYGRYKWPFEAIHNDDERSWEYIMYSDTAKKVRKLTRA
jgi:hypothetical protein